MGCGEHDGWAYRLRETLEGRNVGPGRELDADLAGMGWIVIVLSQALADLAGGDSDDGVGVGVIAGRPPEDLHADGALLDLVGVTGEGLFDDEAEQNGIPSALGEKGMNEEQFELSKDRGFVRMRLRHPRLEGGAGGSSGLDERFLRRFHAFYLALRPYDTEHFHRMSMPDDPET